MRQKSGPVKESAEKVVKDIRRATRRHFSAEDKIRIVLADNPAFIHAFAGLLNLADWIGSDERFFPVADEGQRRFSRAWA